MISSILCILKPWKNKKNGSGSTFPPSYCRSSKSQVADISINTPCLNTIFADFFVFRHAKNLACFTYGFQSRNAKYLTSLVLNKISRRYNVNDNKHHAARERRDVETSKFVRITLLRLHWFQDLSKLLLKE